MVPSPFQIFATAVFGCAILHIFLSGYFRQLSLQMAYRKAHSRRHWKYYHAAAEVFYLLGEVEIILGLWLIPLFIGYGLFLGKDAVVFYLNSRDFTQPLYILVIIVVVSSRPIIRFSERILEWFARIGGDTPASWWWTILTLGPLMSALLKETGAMTLSALLLIRKFYRFESSRSFRYVTLGLLFTNIAVGGLLAPFSSRSLLLTAKEWGWTTSHVFMEFGWKAIVGIFIINLLVFLFFRREFDSFPKRLPTYEGRERSEYIPFWVTAVHLTFLTLIVLGGENAPIFVALFLLFLGFYRATSFYQSPLHLKPALLVAFFFASLIVHGGLQGWWVQAILRQHNEIGIMAATMLLSIFIDNATVLYLAAQVPTFSSIDHYYIVAGAVVGGGLTVIANAPNLIGYSLLRGSFKKGLSFVGLFLGALLPALFFFVLYWLLQ